MTLAYMKTANGARVVFDPASRQWLDVRSKEGAKLFINAQYQQYTRARQEANGLLRTAKRSGSGVNNRRPLKK